MYKIYIIQQYNNGGDSSTRTDRWPYEFVDVPMHKNPYLQPFNLTYIHTHTHHLLDEQTQAEGVHFWLTVDSDCGAASSLLMAYRVSQWFRRNWKASICWGSPHCDSQSFIPATCYIICYILNIFIYCMQWSEATQGFQYVYSAILFMWLFVLIFHKHVDMNMYKCIMAVWTVYWQIESCLSNPCGLVSPSSQSSGQPHRNLINSSPSPSWDSAFSCWRGSWLICPSVCLSTLTSVALKGQNWWRCGL